MATKPEAETSANAPAKSKKMLMIIVGVVLVVVLGGGAFFYVSKQRADAAEAEEGGESAPAKAAHAAPKTPPVYLPLDSMVVNLADAGGEKVAQVGVTLEVRDVKASDSVKVYLPTIRSGVLMLISQRTSAELLSPEGKQKLAAAILRETSIPFGGGEDDEEEEEAPKKKKSKKKAASVEYPVVSVLFSSFIVQ